MTYVIYGRVSFNSRGRRDNIASTISNYATQNGFTPMAFDGMPAGVAVPTNTSVTFSYSTESFTEIEEAEAALMQALQSNQYEGNFNWQML